MRPPRCLGGVARLPPSSTATLRQLWRQRDRYISTCLSAAMCRFPRASQWRRAAHLVLLPSLDWGRMTSGAVSRADRRAIYREPRCFCSTSIRRSRNLSLQLAVARAHATARATRFQGVLVRRVGVGRAAPRRRQPHARVRLRDALRASTGFLWWTERRPPPRGGRATIAVYRLARESRGFTRRPRSSSRPADRTASRRHVRFVARVSSPPVEWRPVRVEDRSCASLSSTLAQHYGIIHAEDRGKRAGAAIDTRVTAA